MSEKKKTCFVVMGFGTKTDLATGRKLDLDKSYRLLIKPAVEAKDLVCIRADEILHSGSIESQMYQELLTADVVIADLSTANPNAIYELGIRHALRPFTTIVISENKLIYPFDLNHIVIEGYSHLGEAIDFEEVIRFREVLVNKINAVLTKQDTDSPVYTFLQQLTPPFLKEKIAEAIAEAGKALGEIGTTINDTSNEHKQTISMLVQQGEEAIQESDFDTAKFFIARALKVSTEASSVNGSNPENQYLVQRLALATYKAKKPDPVTALKEALQLLEPLNPRESNDPETLGIAGAIEKRLYESGEGNDHLSLSIRYYERGYLIRNDWYNGINLAYLFNLRVDSTIYSAKEEKVADIIWANRLRREIVTLCQQKIDGMQDQLDRAEKRAADIDASTAIEIEKLMDDQFWCIATKAEAHFGLGETEEYEKALLALKNLKPAQWMIDSFESQINKLSELLNRQSDLLQSL
ncbi:tetratricopeptide repeat-containing protein [Runella sp.]|uniref:tetratricopeptide repeat-containing protein n=1 Tax=Runella sp. TaxID=1960881 RepID=UPI003D11BF5B